MKIDEKLLEAHVSISRLIIILTLVMSFVSLYIFGRAINVFFDPDFAIKSITSVQQGTWYGLRLSYISMTFFWPIVLSAISSSIVASIYSYNRASKAALDCTSESNKWIFERNPYHWVIEYFSGRPFWHGLASYLPYFVILLHSLFLIFIFINHMEPPSCYDEANEVMNYNCTTKDDLSDLSYYVYVLLSVASVIMSLIILRGYRAALISLRDIDIK